MEGYLSLFHWLQMLAHPAITSKCADCMLMIVVSARTIVVVAGPTFFCSSDMLCVCTSCVEFLLPRVFSKFMVFLPAGT